MVVEVADGGGGGFLVSVFGEAEAFGTTGFAVVDETEGKDAAGGGEDLGYLLFCQAWRGGSTSVSMCTCDSEEGKKERKKERERERKKYTARTIGDIPDEDDLAGRGAVWGRHFGRRDETGRGGRGGRGSVLCRRS